MATRKSFFCLAAVLLGVAALSACGTSPVVKPTGDASAAPISTSAQAAFQAALRGYENENLKPLEALLPARFVGRSLLLDAAQTTRNEQKQIRIMLTEIRITPGVPGSSTQALSAKWDKRFLRLPGLMPALESGNLQAVMSRESGQWQLDSLSADNPFSK